LHPSTINHYIGQPEVVSRFKVALEAAWNDGTRLPHMLLCGPPGCGKTLLAHLAARETGVALHERIGQVLDCMGAVNGLLAQAQDKEVVFIDEIHEMPSRCQTLLYRAVEDRTLFVRGRDRRTLSLSLNDYCLVAATTDEYAVLPPLRDRFKLILQFKFYDIESIAKIVSQRAHSTGIEMDAAISHAVASRSRGTPRLAIRLLEACYRYARSKGEYFITTKHFEETAALEQIDPLGLDADQQRYLAALGKQRRPIKLHTLESTLGIHRRTLQTVVEPYLLRVGLIERAPSGRVITEAGMVHLGISPGPHLSVA
jgi:Holliday junction DNA helicase RuvB